MNASNWGKTRTKTRELKHINVLRLLDKNGRNRNRLVGLQLAEESWDGKFLDVSLTLEEAKELHRKLEHVIELNERDE
jgi:hypothetical protein